MIHVNVTEIMTVRVPAATLDGMPEASHRACCEVTRQALNTAPTPG